MALGSSCRMRIWWASKIPLYTKNFSRYILNRHCRKKTREGIWQEKMWLASMAEN